MPQVEFFRWLLPPDKWNKRPHLSRWKMSREEAEKRYPGATPDLMSREVGELPEPGEYVPTLEGRPWAPKD
jgi:hypothetical protein